MSYVEDALTIVCEGSRLMGIVSRPPRETPGQDVGVVIIVGGPQYRAGSHRQFVQLARVLAETGYPVLRFDCRGMGDSEGEARSFEQTGADIGAAIDALQRAAPAMRRVVLWGLCDGASAALLYVHEHSDPRVAGLALLNPWVRSEASLAKTHVKHYYRQRLAERAFWLKLLSGKVALDAVVGLLRNVRAAFGPTPGTAPTLAPYQQRMAQAWSSFKGQVLLILSQNDYTAREFVEFTSASPAWRSALAGRPGTQVDIAGADHTCSQPGAKRAVALATARWLTATL